MKFTLLYTVIILLLSISSSYGQNRALTITGRVLDEETGIPLSNVNVFLANTTFGTTTEKTGEFSLTNIPYGNYDIIFSYVGYEQEKRNFYSYEARTFHYNISLKQKVITLTQVNVTAAVPENWKEDLKIFTRIFIGEGKNSDKTRILNPEVLNFIRDDNSSILKAVSDSIIRIENRSLGYTLYIFLDWLEYNVKDGSIKFMLYPRFSELTPSSEEERHTWEDKRKSTYLNSSKYFFYALVHKQLNMDYSLKSGEDNIYQDDLSITSNSDSTIFEFRFQGDLLVRRHLGPPSSLAFLYPSVSIDKYGNLFSPYLNVIIGGIWADQRIADMLPLNYIYTDK